MIGLTKSKGEDYTTGNSDQLSNLKQEGDALNLLATTVWHVFANKHWRAITSYVQNLQSGDPRQPSEPILERVDDLILYLILLKGLVMDFTGQTHLLNPHCPECKVPQGNVHLPSCSKPELELSRESKRFKIPAQTI